MDIRQVVEAIDYDRAFSIIASFIQQQVEGAGARGVVLGLSGGVDSTVAVALAAKALGPQRVWAIHMPSRYTPPQDTADAKRVAEVLGVNFHVVDISPIYEAFLKALPEGNDVARGNLQARIRMAVLYYYANRHNLLVVGSGDRSELLLGYFTKYGDGAADLLPIGCLYKTQVREAARRLGFGDIANKPSSPRLWEGHTAEGELGASYEAIDLVLYALFDLKMPAEQVKKQFGTVAELVLRRVAANWHKIRPPPVPDIAPARR